MSGRADSGIRDADADRFQWLVGINSGRGPPDVIFFSAGPSASHGTRAGPTTGSAQLHRIARRADAAAIAFRGGFRSRGRDPRSRLYGRGGDSMGSGTLRSTEGEQYWELERGK